MATGSLDANGIWQYGEDDSEATASALLNKLGGSVSSQIGTLFDASRILQVVQNTTNTATSTSSTSFVDTGLSHSITPTSSTSKILILASPSVQGGGTAGSCGFTLFRGNSSGTNLGNGLNGLGRTGSDTSNTTANANVMYLDEPATTATVSYTFAIRRIQGTLVYLNPASAKSTIILIEVAAS